MRYPLAYATPVFIAALVVIGFYLGGPGFFAFPIAMLLIIPAGDELIGVSLWPSEHRLRRQDNRVARLYEQMLALGAATTFALLAWALWAASAVPLARWELAGLAVSVGMMTGFVGIPVAHELLHRSSRFAFPLMAIAGYSQFCVTHIRSHHVVVATPDDAATARYGESLYAFLPRWLFGGLRKAWEIERRRLGRAGRSAFSPRNRLLRWHGFTLLIVATSWLALGPKSALLFIGQAAVAMTTLWAIDYIEHYGLLRARNADGGYERVGSAHTWNSNYVLSNVGLFNLGRHTAHHNRAAERYYRLRADAAAPQLPYGIATMILIALIPSLWFRVMHRTLADWRARGAVA